MPHQSLGYIGDGRKYLNIEVDSIRGAGSGVQINGYLKSGGNTATLLAANRTLTLEDSGSVYEVDTSGGAITVVLPAPAIGINYYFAALTVGNDLIVSANAGGGNYYGIVDSGVDGVSDIAAIANDVLTMGTLGVGDWVEVTGTSTNFFHVRGHNKGGDAVFS